jgi:hypothetical protein
MNTRESSLPERTGVSNNTLPWDGNKIKMLPAHQTQIATYTAIILIEFKPCNAKL